MRIKCQVYQLMLASQTSPSPHLGAGSACGIRDPARDNDGPCDPSLLPPGAGISPCARLLDADDQPWRRPDPTDQQPPPELKPLWVPPLAPSVPSRRL